MKKTVNIIAFLFTILIVILLFIPLKSRINNLKKQKELEKVISEKLDKAKKRKEELESEVNSLRDKNNLEKFTRNNLNMGKKGEKIYIFIDKKEKEEKNDK